MDTELNSPRRHSVKITYGKRRQEPDIKTTSSSFPFSSPSITTSTPPTSRLRLFRTESNKQVGPQSRKNRASKEELKSVDEDVTPPAQPQKTPGKRGRKRRAEMSPNIQTTTKSLKKSDHSNQSTPRKRGRPSKKQIPKNSDSEIEFLEENVEISSVRKSNRFKLSDKRAFQTDLPLHPAPGSLVVDRVEIPPKATDPPSISVQEKLVEKEQSAGEEKSHDLKEESCPEEQEMKKEHQDVDKSSMESSNEEQVKQGLVLSLAEKTMGPTTCEECGLSFNLEDNTGDTSHETFHKAILHGIDYPGYKHDQVIEFFADEGDSVIVISKQSNVRERKKAKEIVHYINTYLGSTDLDDSRFDECKIYIYVRAKKVIGCVVAEPIDKAYRLRLNVTPSAENVMADSQQDKQHDEPNDDTNAANTNNKLTESTTTQLDHTPTTAICGIHRMWVCSTQRHQGIASRLLDTVCKNFLYGCPLRRHELAFSQPTPSGKGFAQSYTNTPEYLIYVEKA